MEKETREHKKYRGRSEFARTTCKIECPFCGTTTTAYVWSLAGSGKRCDSCPAIHGSMGMSVLESKK